VAISFHSEGIRFDLKQKKKHKKWIRSFIESHKKNLGKLSYIFTSNEQILLLNREYLNHNYFTDVITFDYAVDDIIAGDIFISIEQVKKNAEFYGVDTEEELRRVMIHGILHLLDYKDSSLKEQKTMRKKENEALHLWMKPV
jgi:rRNA maturation RNase YbeY